MAFTFRDEIQVLIHSIFDIQVLIHSIFDIHVSTFMFRHSSFDIQVSKAPGPLYRRLCGRNGSWLSNMAEAGGIVDLFLYAHNIVEETITRLDNLNDPFELDGLVMRLEYLNRTLVNVTDTNLQVDGVIRQIGSVIDSLTRTRDASLQSSSFGEDAIDFAPKAFTNCRGRPSFDIKEEQLSFLLEEGFKVAIIAELFCVSTRTVERRMSTFGLSVSGGNVWRYISAKIKVLFSMLKFANFL